MASRTKGPAKTAEAAPAAAAAVATAPPAQDLVTSTGTAPTTFFTRSDVLNDALKTLRDGGYNLLGTKTISPVIPQGFGVALNVIKIDPTPPDKYGKGGGGDVYLPDAYRDKDGFAYTKVLLDKIAAAGGLTWLPQSSKRLDDGRDTWYCMFRAVGKVMDFDGTVRTVTGEKEIDLRPGSPLWKGYRRSAERAVTKDFNEKSRDPSGDAYEREVAQRLDQRLEQVGEHILALCQSKAQNRVTRTTFAIRSKYTGEDIRRPIVVPKLIVAPETIEDPVLRREVMMVRMRHAMGVGDQLFGPTEGEGAPQAFVDVTPPQTETPTPPPPINPDKGLDPDDDIPIDEDGGNRPDGEEDPW